MKYQDEPINPILLQQEGSSCDHIGLTKLEYFTAAALQGLLASDAYKTQLPETIMHSAITIAADTLKRIECRRKAL